jgi:hypothetical protein
VDDAREFGLQCLDAFCDDRVWAKTADCFDVVEEAGRYCIVIEGLVWIRGTAVKIYALVIFGPTVSVSLTC